MPKISTLQSCSDAMIDDIVFFMKIEWCDFTAKHLGLNTFSELKAYVFDTYLKGGVYPIMFVMHEDNELIGFISVDGTDHKDYVHIAPWVNNLYVVAKHRGQAHSKALMKHALKHLCANYFDVAYLCCKPTLQDFYAGMGWNVVDDISDNMVLMATDPTNT